MGRGRILYLEALRIIAVFFVIFTHTGEYGAYLYLNRPVGSISFWLCLFLAVFGQFCVPVFWAVSGAVLLGRENEKMSKWAGRIVQMFITLVVFSFAYYIKDVYKFDDLVFSWRDFFTGLYSGPIKYHLWFLYLYLVYLLTLPFLKAMVANLSPVYFRIMFCAAIILNGIIPILEYILFKGQVSLSPYKTELWVVNGIVLYPCMGYYICNHADVEEIRRRLPLLWCFNLAGIALSGYMTYYYGITTGIFDQSISGPFYASFVMINCLTLFATFKYLAYACSVPDYIKKAVSLTGSCVFGIYLFHVFFIQTDLYYQSIDRLRMFGINDMLVIWFICAAVFILAFLLTLIISKIPFIRKIVGFR